MYLNRMGMAIKADDVVVRIGFDDLSNILETVVQRTTNREVTTELKHHKGQFSLLIHTTDEKQKSDVLEAGYSFDAGRDFATAMAIFMDVPADDLEAVLNIQTNVVNIFMNGDDYVKKCFNL